YHVFWLVNDLPMDQFELVQSAIAKRFGADPKCKDLSRVLRVPGFWNWKHLLGAMTKIIDESGAQPDNVDAVVAEFKVTADSCPHGQSPWSEAGSRPAKLKIVSKQELILEGNRNDALTSLAGSMRARGMEADAIQAALQVHNRNRCEPPLEDAEVAVIARSVGRYKPDDRKQTNQPSCFVQKDKKPASNSMVAELLAESLCEEIAYDPFTEKWYVFVGTHFQVGSANAKSIMLDRLDEFMNPIGYSHAYANGIWALMSERNSLLLPTSYRHNNAIPFLNGILDIETNKLEPTTPENSLTWVIPHNYVETSNCTRFLEWVEDALEDKEQTELLRAFINACLIQRYDLQVFLTFLGPGGTGKSTFLRILFALLGPMNCVTTNLESMEKNQFETSRLYGKKLTAIMDAGRYIGSVDVLKSITGGDFVRYERKYHNAEEGFTYKGMVVIASNEPLASIDHTSGLSRRQVVIEFSKRFSESDRTFFEAYGGEQKILDEIPEIINWALALSADDVTNRFTNLPEKVKQSTQEALFDQNPVSDWISENLIAC
ncbi:MAG: phage/plasmid primase, P4 family, partial [Polaromonas sp.]